MKTGVLSLLLFWACYTSAQEYHVKKVAREAVRVDGKGGSTAWGTANLLTDFVYPWDSAVAPATSFSALWDGEWLYGLYRVKDDSIFTVVKRNDKIDVAASDRVEIFLKKDDLMNPYYCLELDADGRVLDYNAFYYRKVNYPWSWPSGQLTVKAARVRGGYIVEFGISIRSLQDLGLLKDGRLQAGLFRAECKGIVEGRSDLRWISWVRPRTDHPDFHTPSAFGVLVLD